MTPYPPAGKPRKTTCRCCLLLWVRGGCFSAPRNSFFKKERRLTAAKAPTTVHLWPRRRSWPYRVVQVMNAIKASQLPAPRALAGRPSAIRSWPYGRPMKLRFNNLADRLHAALDITRDARVLAGASLPVDATNVFTAIATSCRFVSVPRGGASVTLLQQRAPQAVRARARTSCTGRRRPSARRRTVAAGSDPPGDQPQPAPSCWGVGEQSSVRRCALVETGGLRHA